MPRFPQMNQLWAAIRSPDSPSQGAPNGGSRATAATSDRHAARVVFQNVSDPIADYELPTAVGSRSAARRRLPLSARPMPEPHERVGVRAVRGRLLWHLARGQAMRSVRGLGRVSEVDQGRALIASRVTSRSNGRGWAVLEPLPALSASRAPQAGGRSAWSRPMASREGRPTKIRY
jgi:hypothetical protein